MNYFVGDLARLLNLSSEMIRYYEKMEMFKPDRQEGNNYRIYSAKDLLLLLTAMQLQTFQVKIKDIRKMRNLEGNGYTKEVLSDLITFREEIIEELAYKNWVLMRVNELIERNQMALLNEKNNWFKRRPEQYRYPFLRVGQDGEFECLLPESVTRELLSDRVIPFCDFTVETEEKGRLWSLAILKEYGDYLKLPDENRNTVQSFFCASTILKAEEFSEENFRKLQDCIKERNYYQSGKPDGLLCGGMTLKPDGYFVELQIPIEKA